MARWSDDVEWGVIPDRMRPGIIRYIEDGIPTGGFLQAIFQNDLLVAARRADDENRALLPAYAAFLVDECPAACFGSAETVKEWVKRRGINGGCAP